MAIRPQGMTRIESATMNSTNQQPVRTAKSKGQKRSQERGSAQRGKKNPGKRPGQGGS
jgi:hypothetical protein